MDNHQTDALFTGSIPEIYDAYLVPLIFAPYALDLAGRVAARRPKRVLEVAAGTGALTRAMADALPDDTTVVATDLNVAMLDRASSIGTRRPVEWRQADVIALPFAAETFDVVVCAFGVMFFPDRARAFAEVRRVLAPGGMFLFNVWDRVEENEFAAVVMTVVAAVFPDDPPTFVTRTPHGYYDRDIIARDLQGGGFDAPPAFETLTVRSRAASSRVPAIAYCQGTPLRNEIEKRRGDLATATDACADGIAKQFGSGPVDGKIQAHIVAVEA